MQPNNKRLGFTKLVKLFTCIEAGNELVGEILQYLVGANVVERLCFMDELTTQWTAVLSRQVANYTASTNCHTHARTPHVNYIQCQLYCVILDLSAMLTRMFKLTALCKRFVGYSSFRAVNVHGISSKIPIIYSSGNNNMRLSHITS